eukprot:GHVS01053134.1.p1 GENE.GHVS01053134.1~~GHVS01053134.1.p1  ORF type:complete len:645 (-),score=149.77 GHVS01053134.1:184-2118(-)
MDKVLTVCSTDKLTVLPSTSSPILTTTTTTTSPPTASSDDPIDLVVVERGSTDAAVTPTSSDLSPTFQAPLSPPLSPASSSSVPKSPTVLPAPSPEQCRPLLLPPAEWEGAPSSLSHFLSPIFASLRLPPARCAQIRRTLADADIFCLRTLLRYARSVAELQSLVPGLSPVMSQLIVHKLNDIARQPSTEDTSTMTSTATTEWPIFSNALPPTYSSSQAAVPASFAYQQQDSLDHALFSNKSENTTPVTPRWTEGFCSVYRKLATPCEMMGGDENCSLAICDNKDNSPLTDQPSPGNNTRLSKEASKKALSRRFFTPKKGPLPQSARRALPTSQKNDVKKIVELIQQKHPLHSDDVAVCWDYSDLQWRAKLRFKGDGEIQQFTRPPVDYTEAGLLEARQLLIARVKQYVDDRQANGIAANCQPVVRKSPSKIRQLAAVPFITHWRSPLPTENKADSCDATTTTSSLAIDGEVVVKGRKRGRVEGGWCGGGVKKEETVVGSSRKRLYGSGVCLYTTVQRRAMPKAFKEEVQQIAEDLKLECEKERNREDENRWHCRWEFRDMQWRGCLKTGNVPVHFTRAPYDMTRPAMKAALDFIIRRIQIKCSELGSPIYRTVTAVWNSEESVVSTTIGEGDNNRVKMEEGSS